MDGWNIQEDLLPGPDEVAEYEAKGWYLSRFRLPADVLQAAEVGCARLYQGDLDHRLPDHACRFNWSPGDGNVLRLNCYASLMVDEFKAIVRHPMIGATASRLCREPTVRLWRDAVLWKPPQEGATHTRVGWHTDRAYWQTCTSDVMLTAWVPLQACNAGNGTLSVIEGSHLWKEWDHLRGHDDQDMDSAMAGFRASGLPITPTALELARGQVSFHHCRLLHGSADNFGVGPRVSVAVHIQNGSNRYRPWYNANGEVLVHSNDLICRRQAAGWPDYADPKVFPVLWPESVGDTS